MPDRHDFWRDKPEKVPEVSSVKTDGMLYQKPPRPKRKVKPRPAPAQGVERLRQEQADHEDRVYEHFQGSFMGTFAALVVFAVLLFLACVYVMERGGAIDAWEDSIFSEPLR